MIECVFEQCGPPEEVVSTRGIPSSSLVDGTVRVEVQACPINPADINFIEGKYGVKPTLPAVPGMEGCGTVIESRHSLYAIGDQVIFLKKGGSWAQQLIAKGDELIAISQAIDPLQCSMLGVNPLTALRIIEDFASLKDGDVVIQNAANSNVGRCIIQLCATRGITTVNTVRRPELIEELKTLGADHVFLDDAELRKNVDFLSLPAPKLAVNCVNGDSALQQLKLLGTRGVQVTFGAMARKPLTVPAGLMIFKELELRGFWVSQWTKTVARDQVQDAYNFLAEEVRGKRLIQAIDETFPLSEVSAALSRAQEGGRDGKVILLP